MGIKVCPKCKTNYKLFAYSKAGGNTWEYECGHCGHKFTVLVLQTVRVVEKK